MTSPAGPPAVLPRPRALRWEIAAALLLKVILLIGLWYLIFRWDGDSPPSKPDVAEHLAPPPSHAAAMPTDPVRIESPSTQTNHQEASHVRR